MGAKLGIETVSGGWIMDPFMEAEFGTLVRKCGIVGREVNTARRYGAPDNLACAPHYIDNQNVQTDAVVVPVYGFQHGGPIVYKASKHGDPFRFYYYGFDSGLAGIAFVSGRRVKQLTTRKKNPYTVQQIEARLIELVQEQSDYETDGAKYWFDCTVDELLEDEEEHEPYDPGCDDDAVYEHWDQCSCPLCTGAPEDEQQAYIDSLR